MSAHEHLREEDLLAVLLAPRPGRETRARLRDCPVCGPELADMERDVAQMRAALAAAAPRTSAGLTERILARTSREDLGLRGEARLIFAFVRTRLRSSRALRVAAAVLFLHLLALPALAYFVWRAEHQRYPVQVTSEPSEPVFEPAREPEPELIVPEPETPPPSAVVPGDVPARR